MTKHIKFDGQFSLCDSRITEINEDEKTIEFIFGKGVLYINNEYIEKRSRPLKFVLEKVNCDYMIYLTKELNFERGKNPVYITQEINLKVLKKLVRGGTHIVIFDEINCDDRFYWRCQVEGEDDNAVRVFEEILISVEFSDKTNYSVFLEE